MFLFAATTGAAATNVAAELESDLLNYSSWISCRRFSMRYSTYLQNQPEWPDPTQPPLLLLWTRRTGGLCVRSLT